MGRKVAYRIPTQKRSMEPTEELAKAAKTLIILEALSAESELSYEEAQRVAKEVSRRAWGRLRNAML